LLEGPRVIEAALDRQAHLTEAYLGYGARAAFSPLVKRLEAAGVATLDLKEGVLEKVGTTQTPQPVLAVAPWQATALEALLEDGDRAGLVVVLVDVSDPGNLGTILRSAEAAGTRAVVITGSGVDVRNPKVVRASAGAVFGLPVVEAPQPDVVIDELQAAGIRCFGAVAVGGRPPDDLALGHAAAVVMGNEAHGLNAAVLARLDGTVTIPMAGVAESLNVAMATSVLCFEAARQRRVQESA
jgi:RNA methyltransferase, TrmH family